MHELAMAQSLLNRVLDEAARNGGGRITRVKLRIGALSHVSPESLEFAFEVIAKGTPAEGAKIETERPAPALHCHACGLDSEGAPGRFSCAECGSGDVELLSGDELMLESFHLERDDNQAARKEG